MPSDFLVHMKRIPNDGIYEASVLTIGACHNIYSGILEGAEFLQWATITIVNFGGLILRGSEGHLVGCFIGKNLADGAIRAVDCAYALKRESQKLQNMHTFFGVNTGPVLLKSAAETRRLEHQVKASGRVLPRSEALAFSLHPGMIVLSPATFHMVASLFDCYGTSAAGVWGESKAASETIVYVVNGPKKTENWKHCLEDDSVPLMGREKELEVLRLCWAKARLGREGDIPSVVHLVGDPGSGKSKLLQAFLARITAEYNRVKVLKVAGSHYGRRPGLLLQELLRECSSEGMLAQEQGTENLFARAPTPGRVPFIQFGGRIRRLHRLIQALGGHRPLIVVVDDLHWADKESVRIIGKALGQLSGGIMVIVSYRRSGLKKAQLLLSKNTRRVVLKPIDESTGKKISTFHSENLRFSESVWQAIWQKSKGNPLYIEEATKLLCAIQEDETGVVEYATKIQLPDTLAGLMVARIKDWSNTELNGLKKELQCRIGQPSSLLNRLHSIETQTNDWLDRLETSDYTERSKIAACLEILEKFQDDVIMICIVNRLSRPLTTRLGMAVSRLYNGCYTDHYRYLQRRAAASSGNLSSLGLHALRVARMALDQGRPRQALAFFKVADEALSVDHPLKKGMFMDAGDANLMLGCLSEAIECYERSLKEECQSETQGADIRFRLGVARILKGEAIDLSISEQLGDYPWAVVLKCLAAIVLGNMEMVVGYATQVRADVLNWVSGGFVLLLGALARLESGDSQGAVVFCTKMLEMVPTGGVSLISFGLHWVLSRATEGHNRQRHIRTMKGIAKRLGITAGMSLYESRLFSWKSQQPQKRDEGLAEVML